jgi:hypothetical protein
VTLRSVEQSGAPPSIALAVMIARNAGFYGSPVEPAPREEVHCSLCYPLSLRYYELMDRLNAGGTT